MVTFAAIWAGLLVAAPARAGVTTSTEMRDYRVRGTNRASLVAYMKENPFPGDEGPAYANIRQAYSLSLQTREEGSACRPAAVNVHIHFVMTLPKAEDASALAGASRASWYQFVAFARHHEETRRSIFIACGEAFVAKAMQVRSTSGCMALDAKIRSMFEAAKAGCDRRQFAYGRADDPRVRYLSLFHGGTTSRP
jgi:predicted secreted Zn-dependent protease